MNNLQFSWGGKFVTRACWSINNLRFLHTRSSKEPASLWPLWVVNPCIFKSPNCQYQINLVKNLTFSSYFQIFRPQIWSHDYRVPSLHGKLHWSLQGDFRGLGGQHGFHWLLLCFLLLVSTIFDNQRYHWYFEIFYHQCLTLSEVVTPSGCQISDTCRCGWIIIKIFGLTNHRSRYIPV